MKIKVNGYKILDINKPLTVKDGRLYNTETKCFEGVDGDSVTFTITRDSNEIIVMGTVHGYTCGDTITIRPNETYHDVKGLKIEHISSVKFHDETEELNLVKLVTS